MHVENLSQTRLYLKRRPTLGRCTSGPFLTATAFVSATNQFFLLPLTFCRVHNKACLLPLVHSPADEQEVLTHFETDAEFIRRSFSGEFRVFLYCGNFEMIPSFFPPFFSSLFQLYLSLLCVYLSRPICFFFVLLIIIVVYFVSFFPFMTLFHLLLLSLSLSFTLSLSLTHSISLSLPLSLSLFQFPVP